MLALPRMLDGREIWPRFVRWWQAQHVISLGSLLPPATQAPGDGEKQGGSEQLELILSGQGETFLLLLSQARSPGKNCATMWYGCYLCL